MDSVGINPTANLASADLCQACGIVNVEQSGYFAALRAPELEGSLLVKPENAARLDADARLALFRHLSS